MEDSRFNSLYQLPRLHRERETRLKQPSLDKKGEETKKSLCKFANNFRVFYILS